MTPIDAALKEITLEMEALRRRIGNGPMPGSLTVHVEFDRVTGMPKAIDLEERHRRHIQGGRIDRPRRVG